jgi:hypothetical protein
VAEGEGGEEADRDGAGKEFVVGVGGECLEGKVGDLEGDVAVVKVAEVEGVLKKPAGPGSDVEHRYVVPSYCL